MALFFVGMTNVLAQNDFKQKNTHFSHTLASSASPEAIWHIWTDIDNWPAWDKGLKEATLEGTFEENARGKLIPDKGPKSKFRIVNYIPGKEYTLKTKIPLGSLNVRRYLKTKDQKTYFTHEVRFRGLFKGLFGLLYGKRYRQMLPSVLSNIQDLAEQPKTTQK